MQTSINLQEAFGFLTFPLVIVIFLIILETCYLIYSKKTKEKQKNQEVELKVIPEKNIKNVPVIKSKYLKQLDIIQDKYINQKIGLREAYQLISENIRMFVFEITDITTQNYSLLEIKRLDIPILYELIEEYYEPEFASKSVGDFDNSINKARRVINEWN